LLIYEILELNNCTLIYLCVDPSFFTFYYNYSPPNPSGLTKCNNNMLKILSFISAHMQCFGLKILEIHCAQ